MEFLIEAWLSMSVLDIIKCVAMCRRHLLGIAIEIKEFGATSESPNPYARYTIGDSNRGQTRAN